MVVSSDETGGDNKIDVAISEAIGEEFNSSIKFNIGDILNVHIHHWVICIFGYFILTISPLKYICLGAAIQGGY